MGIFDDEITLPGTFTQVEADYSYGYDPTLFGTTDSVLIIGTAFNGPVGTPTKVYSVEHAVYIFGSAYDSTTRREASLVAGIQDAWERGCRTIYAVRIGGIEMHKDFNFRVDSPYKLRVASMFPANVSKDCYFAYDNTVGAEKVTIYKPAERATISEKKNGTVTSSTSVLKNTMRIASDYGYDKNGRLVDFINLFNNNINNNVLKLAIVNNEGIDVTSSPEVYSLPIGILHPGVYFIGRSNSIVEEHTEVKFLVKKGDNTDPYDNMDEAYYKTLTLNTDVSQALPIYANGGNISKFREFLSNVSINTTAKEPWKFLETLELSDRAFVKDTIDYEENNLTTFEIYQRLGSGFAITAKATKRTKTDSHGKQVEIAPRIAETPTSDKNRIVPISEGIYNTLEDAEIKYRVIVCANADDSIDGKLPRAKDFKKAFADIFLIAEDKVELTPIVDEKDFTEPKKYEVTIKSVDSVSRWTDRDQVYTGEVFNVVCIADKTFDELQADFKANNKVPTIPLGEQFLVKTNKDTQFELVRSTVNGPKKKNDKVIYAGEKLIANNKLFTGIVDDTNQGIVFVESSINVANSKFTVGGKDYGYVLGNMDDTVFAYKVENGSLVPVGAYTSVFGTEEEDTITVYAENFPFGKNQIIITSSIFNNITLREFVEALNEDNAMKRLFTAQIANEAETLGDDIFSDIVNLTAPVVSKEAVNKHVSYDYNMYIPYRTVDTFARQLAQHCIYTEMKTAPAYGFIGCKDLVNTSLSNIANKVSELANTNYDLYAKKNNGNNMLDRQSLPYPIGKNLNTVFAQYSTSMSNDGYVFKCNGAAGYAGMVSTLPLDQSSTMQPINIPDLDFYLSQSQLDQLTKAGIVTFRKSFTKGIVVTDGITMAPADSVFRRLSSSRIVGACEDLIRAASEPYIGKQNHSANRNALKTAIKSNLNKIVGTLIADFEFSMADVSSTAKLSYVSIDYTIVPIYEIREIRNNIKISDTLSTTSTNNNG